MAMIKQLFEFIEGNCAIYYHKHDCYQSKRHFYNIHTHFKLILVNVLKYHRDIQ